MNQQSDQRGLGQPGLAQQGPAQRDPGHQGSASQGASQTGGAALRDAPRDESQGAPHGPAQGAGNGAHPVKPEATDSAAAAAQNSSAPAGKATGVRNEAVVGPFTVRDVTVFAATLVLFVASLIPMFALRYNLWNLGNLFFLGIGIVLPLVVAALFAARRLAPETKVRIGSLSVDQFASVVASFAVAFFFLSAAVGFTPVALVALIGSLVLLAATVLARFIPFFAGDFLDRTEMPAHVMARESAVPVRKPKPAKAPKPAKPSAQKPAVQGPTAGGQYAAGQTFGAQAPGAQASGDQTPAGRPVGSSAVAGPTGGAGAAAPAGTWPGTNAVDSSPATQTAAVVPSAAEPAGVGHGTTAEAKTPAADDTQLNGVPVSGAAAPSGTATSADDARAASATPATAVHPQVQAHEPVRSQEPIGATVDPASRPEESEQQPVHEAFWFAVAQHRVAVDERTGAPLFGIEPGGWVLALEDRGDEFLVQHTDGRVGVLRDLSNIERG
ncbi:MAG: hypothetical protein K0R37_934 [Arthrobacter sp.]|nr:hypothetical protein [Arthrobacter sp.]